ncbi:hypothetical protein J6590_069721 [Homalodisca vitripennis]|nr:hypothetical protein J6590_069721 [Homalodisca vitripennis]
MGTIAAEITAIAAQGSILEPDLRNIAYDGILRMEMTEASSFVKVFPEAVCVRNSSQEMTVNVLLCSVEKSVHIIYGSIFYFEEGI